MNRRRRLLLVVASLALGPGLAQEQKGQCPTPPAEPPAPQISAEPAPDAELLEFLGSFDEEDGDWIDYLTVTDVAPPPAPRPMQRAPEAKRAGGEER